MQAIRRWDLWGTLGGIALGITDTAILVALGVDFGLGGRDATLLVGAYFTTSFAVLGWAVGALARARARIRRDEATIRSQLAALEESQRALVQQEKLAAIGRLAAGVAHEVRNPLGVIRASASMVRESFAPGEEPYRACEFIVEESDRLNGLIRSLLSFARPTRLRLGAVSFEKLVDRALHLCAEELERRAVEVERAGLGGPPELRADGDLLSQVLLDVITNAAEAVERGGRVVLRSEADAEWLRIEIADDGPGVAPEEAGRIFEPFFTTKDAGTGLGLPMAARIADAHGGALRLVPGAGAGPGGRGACFELRLPIAGPADARTGAL